MASSKETPRQKMIGMMYLVLTALLALNVSKDILDAFVVVNKGLENTNLNFTDRNESLYASFDLAKTVDPVKVTPNWQLAQNIKKQSSELFNFIDKLQKQLIRETDGLSESVADTIHMEYLQSKDNYDTPTNILIGDSEDGSAGSSRMLKNKLDDYKIQLSNCILPKDKNNIKIDINTDAPTHSENNENWEMYNFYHRPLVASLTILSKLKNDVKNAESTVVDYLLKKVDAGSLKFDTVAAKVIAQSNYIILGEEYKADLFVAAFNKTKNPVIEIDNNNLETIEKGVGKYNVKTTKEGIFNYSGAIKMKSGDNQDLIFPFESEYIVAKPMVTVSPTKMNVVYQGLENPIMISVPGVPSENLSISVSNADLIKKGNGNYVLKVNRGPSVDVTVFATMANGEKKNMGVQTFRVKRLPKPKAKLANVIDSGTIAKSTFANLKIVEGFYEGFDFDASCVITSFEMSYYVGGWGGQRVSGNSVESLKAIVSKLRPNDRILFENIKAKGADGIEVSIDPLTIKLN